MGTLRRLLIVALAAGAVLLALAGPPLPKASASSTPLRLRALMWAEAHAGAWYCWGGTGGCFDCSGLVYEAYLHQGVNIGRDTYAMLANRHLQWIPASARQRGDLAFYGSGHVELVTARGTFGALESGTQIGWHRPSGWWRPTAYYRVR